MIPNFKQMKVVDEQNNMTPEFHNYMSQVNQALQLILSNEGTKMPGLTNDKIALLDPVKSANRILVNNDNNTALISLGGVFKTIQTS